MATKAITMSTGLLLLLLLVPAISASAPGNFIRTNCATTLDPAFCFSTLARHVREIRGSPANLARVAINISFADARDVAALISKLSLKPNDDPTNAALQDCTSAYGDAIDQMKRSISEILNLNSNSKDFQLHISNVQTWMSAALTNQDTCADGTEDMGDSVFSNRVVNGKKLTSIALAMINKFAQSAQPKA
ncbi:21 kDa protein-like [Macadamia integrifolia]|uniref:21 kDa protein-like n=1 Tax=Macadamia integrifolia TaxID=60698 RepID=UPI001C4F0796|nr:21 kDa protein-like [Macadamia integrifolia]